MKLKTKISLIIIGGIFLSIIPILLIIYLGMSGFDNNYDITTSTLMYKDVIGKDAKGEYQNKWDMDENIFPSNIDNLNVKDFKMVYYNPWDKQFLSYLVIDYNKEEYENEVNRLKNEGISNYKGYYNVTGFTKYKLLAMNADSYQGFIYAITDNENTIIYVEIIFCNYYMDINYEKEIPNEYLPDNFDAKINNSYREKMLKN